MAKLLASVPDAVKIISLEWQPIRLARVSLDSSTFLRVKRPLL